MRKQRIMAPLVLALLATGCGPVTSLHPLYTRSSVSSDPALPGTWAGDGDLAGDAWTFEKSGDDAFALVRTSEGEQPDRFDIHLVRLGQFLFLDASRRDETVSTHILGRVWIEGDVLRIALIDEDWLKAALSRKEVSVRYERLANENGDEDQIVLTASTEELQKLMLTCAKSVNGFSEPLELHRQK